MLRQTLRKMRLISNMLIHSAPVATQKNLNTETQDADCPTRFLLDESALFELTPSSLAGVRPDWMYPTHMLEPRYALVLVAGQKMQSAVINVAADSRLYMRFTAGLPEISQDGLNIFLRFTEIDSNKTFDLGCFHIPGPHPIHEWREVEQGIGWLSGRRGSMSIECTPGPQGDPTADWLAIADFCIAPEAEIKLNLAKTHRNLRIKNEIEHFSATYRDEMYKKVQDRQSYGEKEARREIRKLVPAPTAIDVETPLEFKFSKPDGDESVYGYASRLLRENIPSTPPDFAARLQALVNSRGKIKVLSLCSGAARIEASFAAAVPSGVDWTLLDINEDLLQMAARQFSPDTKLDLLVADANELFFTGEKWDVILCVSALHHIVELERLVKFISLSLNEGGEFWSIGEAVGRNGNRLWPEAKAIADTFFETLPERYRVNSHTKKIDFIIPDYDFSIGCFEGIRSEEIIQIIDRRFEPVETYRVNCFLWRMLNLAYSKNYDLASSEDCALINQIVRSELAHYRDGGRGTALWGVYQNRCR